LGSGMRWFFPVLKATDFFQWLLYVVVSVKLSQYMVILCNMIGPTIR
jgi:hypothetical protein